MGEVLSGMRESIVGNIGVVWNGKKVNTRHNTLFW